MSLDKPSLPFDALPIWFRPAIPSLAFALEIGRASRACPRAARAVPAAQAGLLAAETGLMGGWRWAQVLRAHPIEEARVGRTLVLYLNKESSAGGRLSR